MNKAKQVNVYTVARTFALTMASLGLLAGILYSVGGFIIDSLVTFNLIESAETPGLSFGTILAFGALIGMPVIFAIFGILIGTIGALLYNLVVKWLR